MRTKVVRALVAASLIAASFAIAGPASAAPPANDDVANAELVSAPAQITANSTEATAETGEPNGSCWNDFTPAEKTIWYKVAAPEDALYQLSTSGSSYDTQLAIYTGTGFDDFSELACGEDELPGFRTEVSFGVIAGVTYHIQVDGWDEDFGILELAVDEVVPDVTDPVVTVSTPANGAVLAQGSEVLAAYECVDNDGGSGIVSCVGDVRVGAPIDTVARGDKTFTVTGTDAAGNQMVVTHNYVVTAPIAQLVSPADGQLVVQNEVVLADYTCAQGPFGSPIASCIGDVAVGAEIDTATVGLQTFTLTAVDTNGIEKVVVNEYFVGRTDVSCDSASVTIDMTLNGGDGMGTPGDDVIWGTPGNDLIRGFGGNDILCGGGGRDRIRGGSGTDLLVGDGGHDRLFGQGGRDTMLGGVGDDLIEGDHGPDIADGGPGDDLIRGGDGADTIDGGIGDDRIKGQAGPDVLAGGAGDDIVGGNGGNDVLRGDAGDDLLTGGQNDDVLFGGRGFDRCSGNLGTNDRAHAQTCQQTPGIESFF